MRLAVFQAVLALLPYAMAAFSFTVDSTTPKSCGSVKLGWTGGKAPFNVLIIPAYDYPQNISIPANAISNGVGSYTWQVNYPAGTQLVIMMSDATGYGSGGVSQLLTVGSASSNCQMRSTATDFLFYLNETSVDQCGPVQIYWDKSAIAPVTIIGVIPGGQPFVFTSSNGQSSLVWNTNIAAGTQFILAAFDEGSTGIGGSSSLMTVGGSSYAGCIDDSSPSSTPVSAPTATSTGGGVIKTVTAIATVAPSDPASKISTGGIVGIVLGAIIGFIILQALVFWFCCRRQLKALLSHRKEMRGREIKHSDDVDLASEYHRPSTTLELARSASPSRRTSTLWPAAWGGRSSMDDRGDQESGISPFRDHSTTASPLPQSRPLSAVSDFLPPTLPHVRTDSLSSMLSSPLFPDHGEPDGLPYLTTSTLAPSTSSPTQTQSPSSPSLSPPPPQSPLVPTVGRLPPRPTKAQMAASMSTANPDPRHRRVASRDLEGERQPRHEAPEGGFRLHQDAGRLDDERGEGAVEVEDLPPVYQPEWETQSQRGRPRD